jgi:hypothetical protein
MAPNQNCCLEWRYVCEHYIYASDVTIEWKEEQ